MRRLAGIVCAMAMVLSACSTGEPGDDPTTAAPTDGETATETETEQEASQEPGPGIDGSTVKVVFTRPESGCAETPEGSTPSQEFLDKGAQLIDGYVGFMNDEVLADAGWHLEYDIVDDGGQFCPELQSAAARTIIQEIEPFAVLGTSTSPQGPIIADAVTAEGIMHIGGNFFTYEELQDRAPYAWVTGGLSLRGFEALATFIDQRVLGTTVEDRSGDGEQVDRVYGLLAPEGEKGDAYASFLEERLAEVGVELAGTYRFPLDPGVAAQQATTRVTQMLDDGVNTVVWGVDYDAHGSAVEVTTAMAGQEYFPDILTGTPGVAFFDAMHDQSVWVNAYGVSTATLVAIRHGIELTDDGGTQTLPELQGIPENEDGYIQVWQDRLGNASDPQESANPQGYTVWQQLSHMATALLNLEDSVLNAETYSDALDTAAFEDSPNRCTVERLMGRDEPHASNLSWSSDHNGGFTQFTTVYWVNEPREELSIQGHWESFDNFVYFPEASDLPAEATHDTGELGMELERQEPTGFAPWIPCSEMSETDG